MEVYCRKNNILRRLLRAAVIAFAALLLVLGFIGCAAKPDVSFRVTTIELKVGDERDILPYAVFSPATTDNKKLQLSTDGDCVTIDGTTLKAVKPGTARVTARSAGGSAVLTVSVEYRAAHNLSVSHTGNTVQTSENGKFDKVVFTALSDDYIDPETVIEWSVNGERRAVGHVFEFTPDGYGEFCIVAAIGDLSAERTVSVYKKIKAVGKAVGELEQFRNYSPVCFTVSEVVDPMNPRSVYEWRVNGNVTSRSARYEFIPRAVGEYEVELYVNGIKRDINGKQSVKIVSVGDRAPECRVEFDSYGTFVVWDDRAAARSVAVKSPSGGTVVYSRSDVRHSYRFSDGTFDANGIISVCAADPDSYEITVTADSVGETFEFVQYPSSAAQYIAQTILCENSFITSAEDCAKFVAELYACGRTSARAYLAREITNSADKVEQTLSSARAVLAVLSVSATVSVSGEYMDIRFEPYKNAPTVSVESRVRQMPTPLPHIATADRRPDSYTFAIERAKRSVEAENTEQLLIAVMNGVRPIVKENSAAEKAYKLCKNVLAGATGIISKDHTDAEKVHAIHDWLQFVTRRETAGGGTSADFLEGVFGGNVVAGGAVSSLGMSKAFALMCGMEGIPCKIAVRYGQDGPNAYYWNKVELDGLWYNVDAYGGEVAPVGKNAEYLSHSRLLLSDAAMEELGLVSDASMPEAFDDGGAEIIRKRIQGGVYYDVYIDKEEARDYDQVKAVVFEAFSEQSENVFTLRTPQGTTTYSIDAYGVEIVLGFELDEEEVQAVTANVRRAAAEYYEKVLGHDLDLSSVGVQIEGQVLIAGVQKPRNISVEA